MIDYSLLVDYRKDIVHAGRKGMKRGEHLFGDRDYTPIGTKAGAIERGAERGRQAGSMETWDLKDQVDRMKLESDYRKYSMEEETLDYDIQQQITEAKQEKVRQAIDDVAKILGLIKTTADIGKLAYSGYKAINGKRRDREAIEDLQGRAANLESHLSSIEKKGQKSDTK